jgi:hypothetical protein
MCTAILGCEEVQKMREAQRPGASKFRHAIYRETTGIT